MKLKEVAKEYVLGLTAGVDLDHLVHQCMDLGQELHWLKVWDYSTDPLEQMQLIEDLQNKCEFYSFHMTADSINVTYDHGREVVQAKTLGEGLCKAIILNRMLNN
jgi:hypothetical protein